MKNNRTKLFIFLLFLLCLIMGFNYFYQPILKKYSDLTTYNNEVVQSQETESTISQKKSFFEQMSPRQKVTQLLAYPLVIENDPEFVANFNQMVVDLEEGEELGSNQVEVDDPTIEVDSTKKSLISTAVLDWINNNQPGFITVFGQKIDKDSARLALNEVRNQYVESELKPVFAVDHEGGIVQRLSGKDFTILPSWREQCQNSVEKNELFYNSSAKDLAEIGVNVVLSPVLDWSLDNKILGSRVCNDYETSLNTANLYIQIFSSYQIMPVVKHFPGIGKTTRDLHNSFEVIDLGIEDSNPFKEILDLYPNVGLMTAHVGLSGVMEAKPCSLNPDCLDKIVNQYPESLIFSDALEMKSTGYNPDSMNGKSLDQVAVEAILAGNNVLVFGAGVQERDFEAIIKRLEFEYNDSARFRNKVDISVAKILLLKKIDL